MEIRKVTPIDKHIAKKLRQLRRAAGITQDELGKLAGVSFQQVQKYERAQNRISSSKLFEFSQLLKQPISVFFCEIGGRGVGTKKYKTERQILQEIEKEGREILPVIRAFKRIENDYVKKILTSLIISISKPKNKKVKQWYFS
ncbi:MAG: helix-turn-helix transcriptional regulator [Alphaproteobacteria bacterium]|nr:helix-turn-helix transcriptional regulator [Alphaproteobacteria bacterium]